MTPDSRRIVSASKDHTLKIWELATGQCIATLHGLCPFYAVAAAPDLLCAGDAAGNLWILETTTPTPAPSPLMPAPAPPLKLFYSYSHKDEALREELETHLTILKRLDLLESWNDRKITAGTEWEGAIDENLEAADVVLLLVSANFIASKYCFDKEMKRAMQRHEAKEARVIPIFLKDCEWHGMPFGKLQALPKDAKPVTLWSDRDQAWTDVAKGIRRALEEIRAQRSARPT